MPHVLVRRDKEKISDLMVQALTNVLPDLVVKALSVLNSNCEITKDDIGIEVRDFGTFDLSGVDIEIIILAGEHPERRVNFDERRGIIVEGMKNLINPALAVEKINGFVWICLMPDSFEEFIALW